MPPEEEDEQEQQEPNDRPTIGHIYDYDHPHPQEDEEGCARQLKFYCIPETFNYLLCDIRVVLVRRLLFYPSPSLSIY